MAALREQGFLSLFWLQVLALVVSNTMEKSQDILEKEMLTDCLMELDMSELLRLQRSLERLTEEDIGRNDKKQVNGTSGVLGVCDVSQLNKNGTCVIPQALQLTAERRGYDYHPWQPEERPSKLQTLFHISITALAFLSFGGYLLCLIVQAIKSKGATYLHPVATTMVTNGNGGVKRIKVYRRSRRSVQFKRENILSVSDEKINHVYSANFW